MGTASKAVRKNNTRGAKHGTALVRRTRYAILKAMQTVDEGDKPLHEVLADAFRDNPLKFMDTAAKFLPKQLDVDVTHSKGSNNLSDDELADIIATRARERLEGAKVVREIDYDDDLINSGDDLSESKS